MGRRSHKPDPAQRRQVETMAAYGIPADHISRVVDIDPKTLRKHYRDELDLGETKANAQVAGFLFSAAKSGNVTAQIFWLKTRARWRETPVELKHSGSIDNRELCEFSDEELLDIIRASAAERRMTAAELIKETEPVLGKEPNYRLIPPGR